MLIFCKLKNNKKYKGSRQSVRVVHVIGKPVYIAPASVGVFVSLCPQQHCY